MNRTQRIIKYLAVALAIFLIFSIISFLAGGIISVSNIFYDKDNTIVNDKINEPINSDIKLLHVDIKRTNLIIKIGDEFKASSSSQYIECQQNNNKLYITEKKHNWFNKNNNEDLIIYIPADYLFDTVKINSGASRITISNLTTKVLDLELGAGKVDIDNLMVLNDTEIDGGAGEVNVNNSYLNNLNLDMGVGKFDLTASIQGKSEIDHGVGEFNLNLLGNENDYRLIVDKGLGSFKINGETVKDNKVYGTGVNQITIDGGLGSVKINFKNLPNGETIR